ncbi:hypothetical protein SteCoe_20898 [Stentor coeruleus]|uniref:ubiquitinyl hydrolase 1 n=1 Tax=Stentor coeruleus TaxID=5963 RepID=A0A1R2BQW9_9CILI|nr:hypothetical protein SteCoe_20898 [Stentor coeruleus]
MKTYSSSGFVNEVEDQIDQRGQKRKIRFFDIPLEHEIPKTLSQTWLPIKVLKNEFRFNNTYIKNITELKSEYCGWRKVRGDGNCYYRAVIASFLLKIFHPLSPLNKIYQFLQSLPKNELDYPSEFIQAKEKITEYISQLYNSSMHGYENRIECFRFLNNSLQDQEFDLNLIRFTRLLSHYAFTVTHHSRFADFFIADEILTISANILAMGTEAEGIELSSCPLGLGITVRQVNIFANLLYNTFPDETDSGDSLTKVNIICKSRGHYDILYSTEDMEKEKYCLREGCYNLK